MQQFLYNFNRNLSKLSNTNTKLSKLKILVFSGFLIILASTIATYLYASGINVNSTEITSKNNFEILSTKKEVGINDNDSNDTIPKKDTLTILLLGYGGAGHSGRFLTDVIQLVHFDFKNSKISFISIPRDLWVNLPNGTSSKINKAFTLGNKNDLVHSGANISAQMITTVTGIKVDNFISIDFVGFKRAIGYVFKGVDVNVPKTLDDPWYPIRGKEQDSCGKNADEIANLTAKYSGFKLEKQFECRYDHIYFEKGMNHMDGGDALAYVRSRHGSVGGDFSRSQRQQALLIAIKNKLFELKTLENIPEFFKQMIVHTNTDLDIESIKKLAPLLTKTKNFKIKNITLSTNNVFTSSKSNSGQYIIIPKTGNNNWNGVKKYIETELKN